MPRTTKSTGKSPAKPAAKAGAKTGASVALIGVGRMGLALARNWVAAPKDAGVKQVALVDPSPSEAAQALAENKIASLNPAPAPVDILILAVKPQIFPEVAPDLTGWVGDNTLVLSVMAGISIKQMSECFPGARIARCMPNTPGAIGQGATAYSLSDDCKPADGKKLEAMLAPLGMIEGPIKEDLIDAVIAVSGSGPAYVFLLAEAMAAAGRKLGLHQDMADRLARQTVIGAGALMAHDSDVDPADLRRAVTSPNGTTQAALDVLMKAGGLPDIVRLAAEAAAKRSYDLSRGE